jgi:multimeric flavodoxin WrbA
MKVVAFNGSPREKGNTSILIDIVLGELSAEGFETQHYQLGGREIRGCRACYKCAGGIHVFNSINHFFLINQMIVPGSSYWNLGVGRNPGEVESDPEGVHTMKALGRNMAWTMKRLAGKSKE